MHRTLCGRKPYRGGILIEFTFSIPVCISLLFFINDHYRFYELQSKLKSSTYLTASMLQQISNNRTNKQITIKDIRNISYASCLNFFHTTTMFDPYPFGIYYVAHFYYVKRISSDSYQYQKSYGATDHSTSLENMKNIVAGSGDGVSTIRSAQVEAMHPDLICQNDGEERVLIDCNYRKVNWGSEQFNKSKLGFFILNPPNVKSVDGRTNNAFVYQMVITPKPGLFPVKK